MRTALMRLCAAAALTIGLIAALVVAPDARVGATQFSAPSTACWWIEYSAHQVVQACAAVNFAPDGQAFGTGDITAYVESGGIVGRNSGIFVQPRSVGIAVNGAWQDRFVGDAPAAGYGSDASRNASVVRGDSVQARLTFDLYVRDASGSLRQFGGDRTVTSKVTTAP